MKNIKKLLLLMSLMGGLAYGMQPNNDAELDELSKLFNQVSLQHEADEAAGADDQHRQLDKKTKHLVYACVAERYTRTLYFLMQQAETRTEKFRKDLTWHDLVDVVRQALDAFKRDGVQGTDFNARFLRGTVENIGWSGWNDLASLYAETIESEFQQGCAEGTSLEEYGRQVIEEVFAIYEFGFFNELFTLAFQRGYGMVLSELLMALIDFASDADKVRPPLEQMIKALQDEYKTVSQLTMSSVVNFKMLDSVAILGKQVKEADHKDRKVSVKALPSDAQRRKQRLERTLSKNARERKARREKLLWEKRNSRQ